MQIYTRKKKIENYINEDLESSEPDSDSNNEAESDVDNNEQFVKCLNT